MNQDSHATSSSRGSAETARFGVFELDFVRLELRRKGQVINLSQQSLILLIHLVGNPQKVVAREEFQKALWPAGTFVEFDLALYTAMNRLRRDLGDSAAEPLFIETVPKRGYRFIAPVEFLTAPQKEAPTLPPEPVPALPQVSTDLPLAAEIIHSKLPYRRLFLGSAALSVLLAALAAFAFLSARLAKTATARQVYRFALQIAPGHFLYSLAISPLGDQVVYEASHAGARKLYRRYLDEADSRAIQGTDDARSPFFSPDGQSLGFYVANKLKISGPAGIRVLASFSPSFDQWNAIWATDGYIYFNSDEGNGPAIWRLRSTGGAPERLLATATGGHGVIFCFPNHVLSGSQMIYSIDIGPLRRSLHVMSLRTRASTEILEHGVGGQLLPTGHLMYYWNGTLFVAPFDTRRLKFDGAPVAVVNNVRPYMWARGQASVSDNGTLVYLKEGELPSRQLEWIDRTGHTTPLPIPAADYEGAEISPDGHKLALVRREERSRWTVWSYDLASGAWTRLLECLVPTFHVVWSPDSASVVAGSERANADYLNLVRIPIAAPQAIERLTEQPDFGQFPQTWSAKANAILFMEGVHPKTNGDIMVLPLGGDHRVHALVATPGWDRAPSFSPDGRFFVYESDSTGRPEIFIQGYDAQAAAVIGPALQISQSGGKDPMWSPNGDHIFYLDPEQNLMQAAVSGPGKAEAPKELIHHFAPGFISLWSRPYTVAPDGRFLIMRNLASAADNRVEIQVVVNWFDELKKLSPLP